MNLSKFKQNFRPSKWTKYFLALSGTILLAGIIILCVMGFNLGMDFTGGNVVEVQVGEELNEEGTFNNLSAEITRVLDENGLHAASISIIGEGTANASIEVQYQNKAGLDDAEMAELNQTVHDALTEALGYEVSQTETKGATSSAETLTYALMAIFLALIVMLIYIAVRFTLLSGVATVVVLLHDVLLMCAFVLICRIEVNSSFIAAIITILGYSVNNTIIIFDRVRENMKKSSLSNLTPSEIADLSVRQTLNRTINTSVTTILAILLLAIFGVASMQEFILPILFGLIVGTYAAIFISGPIWAYLMAKSYKNNKNVKESTSGVLDEKTKIVDTTASNVVDA